MVRGIGLLLPFLFVSIGVSFGANLTHYETLEIIKHGFDEYLRTNIRPAYLNEALSQLQLPNIFRTNLKIGSTLVKETSNLENGVICGLCNIAVNFLMLEKEAGMTDVQIKNEIKTICNVLNMESDRVCDGVVDLNANIILYIAETNPDFQPAKFCDIMLQEYQCNFTNIEWVIDIPEGQSSERPWSRDSSSVFKILQITDVHMDTLYTPNKVKTCNEPLCCQNDQDDGTEGNSCGYWAEYGNDASENLVDEFIRFGSSFDVDFVYFTGDIISHRIWSTTEEENSEMISKYLQKLKNGFTVPVFPTLGNHESSPLNQFGNENLAPSNISTQWLYNLIEIEWAEWLPNSTFETIAKGGFYTVSPMEGFRLIVLNSNVAYRACWWLLQQDEDPYGQLEWLTNTLLQAEANNESVHIMGHIPTGNIDIIKVWGREYNKIINRFANIITGQFNGHVHVDTFQVYYNLSDPEQAVNVAWNGASLVPFDYANPSFKIYSIDKETFNIVDIEQWTFNLTKANENLDQSPEWYKIYSFRDAFGVSTLQPKNIANLLVDMATNHSRLAEYHLYRYKNSEPAIATGCDQECQKDYLCELSTSVYGENSNCEYLKEMYDNNL